MVVERVEAPREAVVLRNSPVAPHLGGDHLIEMILPALPHDVDRPIVEEHPHFGFLGGGSAGDGSFWMKSVIDGTSS